jgi:hypothetical protein
MERTLMIDHSPQQRDRITEFVRKLPFKIPVVLRSYCRNVSSANDLLITRLLKLSIDHFKQVYHRRLLLERLC